MIKKINIKLFLSYLIISTSTFFIFLWPIRIFDQSIKYILLLNSIPILYYTYINFNDKKKNYFIYLLIFFFLILHLIITNNFKNFSLNSIFEIIFLSFITLFCLSYYTYLIKNKLNMITIFVIIFIISCFLSFLNFRFDDPYFCGGIKDYFLFFSDHVIQSHIKVNQSESELWKNLNYIALQYDKLINFKISFREFIFEENSHLAMIAVPIITYSLFHFNKFNNYLKFLLVFFIIICLIKSSTTLIVGLFLSIFYLSIINFKNLLYKKIFGIVTVLSFLTLIFLSDDVCRNKISPSYFGKNIIDDEKAEIINEALDTKGSLSSALTYKFLNFSFDSFKRNILGTGIGTFNRESIIYSEKNKFDIPNFDTFNLKDGTNNFNKLIVEFGIIGIILYFIVFLYKIKKNIRFEEKCFLIPFIITQSLRGAGYYNGGFALIFIILLISYFSSFKETK